MSDLDPVRSKCLGVRFNLRLQGLPEKQASPSCSKGPPLQPSTRASTKSSGTRTS